MAASENAKSAPINLVREHHYTILCGPNIIKETKKDHAERIIKYNDAIRKVKVALEKLFVEKVTYVAEHEKELQSAKDRVHLAYRGWVDYIAAYTKEKTQEFIDNSVSMEDIRKQVRESFPPKPIHPREMRRMFDEEDFPTELLKEIYAALIPIDYALHRLAYGDEYATQMIMSEYNDD